jgi:hypothetical protein
LHRLAQLESSFPCLECDLCCFNQSHIALGSFCAHTSVQLQRLKVTGHFLGHVVCYRLECQVWVFCRKAFNTDIVGVKKEEGKTMSTNTREVASVTSCTPMRTSYPQRALRSFRSGEHSGSKVPTTPAGYLVLFRAYGRTLVVLHNYHIV